MRSGLKVDSRCPRHSQRMPGFHVYLILPQAFPNFQGLTTHLGLVFAVIAAVVIWFILYRSKWGYEIRLIGDNAKAAKYSGISIGKNIILVMALSGGLAGLAGMSEITGVVHRFQGCYFSWLRVYRNYYCLAGKT